MKTREDMRKEVETFEYNAKEGLRAVALSWYLRRVATPLIVFIVFAIVAATVSNGPIAGVMSALVFSVPLAIVLWFTTDQFKKVRDYWRK